MKAFMLSALFGAVTILLIFALTASHTKGKRGLFTLVLLLLFAVCAAAVWLIVFKYTEYVFYCICGFAVGVPVCAILVYIIMTYFGEKIQNSLKGIFKFRKKRVSK